MSDVLAHFEVEEIEIRNINNEGEIAIYVPGSDEPLVFYIDMVEYVKDVIRDHEAVNLDA